MRNPFMVAALASVLLSIGVLAPPPAAGAVTASGAASGSTRYVNPVAGCDNAGPGTSQGQPWCDLNPVASTTFGPGDELLLARGASWNQQLEIRGSGATGAPIVVGAYGTGSRPLIARNAADGDRAVYLENVSHVTVQDLEVSHAAVGVQAYYDELGHEGLTIQNVYAHHITGIAQGNAATYDGTCASSPIPGLYTSAGVAITGPAVNDASGDATTTPFPFTSADVGLEGLHIRNVEVAHSNMGVEVAWCNGVRTSDGQDGANLVRGAVLEGLYIHDLDGGGDPRADCPNGITLVNMSDSVLRDSIVQRAGACPSRNGTAGLLLSRNDNLVLANNLIVQTPDVGTVNDQMGVDLEYSNHDIQILSNYVAEHHGPGVDVLAIRNRAVCAGSGDPFDHSDDTVIDGNLFEGNGEGAVHRVGNCFTPTGTVSDNLYAEPHGLAVTGPGEDFRGFSFLDNVDVATATRTFQSARDYTGTAGQFQWTRQSRPGGSWTTMTYDAANDLWSGTATSSGRFTHRPATGEAVSLTWTAPTSGTVQVRGRALDVGAAGTPAVRVERNGSTVLAAQTVPSTLTGVETDIDGLSVAAGDVLRFVVEGANGSSVSWMPTVAYDAGSPVLDQANTFGTFYPYSDLRWGFGRMQTFQPQTNATRVDFWAFRSGAPLGNLELRVYELSSSGQPVATVGSRSVPPGDVPATAAPITVATTPLDPAKRYGIAATSPTTPDSGTSNAYGFEYFDGDPYARGSAALSTDSGTTWTADVSTRDLKFATYR
jgi:hypothetical protein